MTNHLTKTGSQIYNSLSTGEKIKNCMNFLKLNTPNRNHTKFLKTPTVIFNILGGMIRGNIYKILFARVFGINSIVLQYTACVAR